MLRVFAGEAGSFGVEERWEGTNTGGDAMFGPAGTAVAVYAFTIYDVRDDRFVRAVAWTGCQNTQGG